MRTVLTDSVRNRNAYIRNATTRHSTTRFAILRVETSHHGVAYVTRERVTA